MNALGGHQDAYLADLKHGTLIHGSADISCFRPSRYTITVQLEAGAK